MVTIMRIDDRLVHGQIVTKWIKEANAKMIVVADDIVAGDDMLATIMKMGVPAGVTLKILTLDDAVAYSLSVETASVNILLLVRSPKNARMLLEKGIRMDTINLGNISNTKCEEKRSRVQLNMYPTPSDADEIRKIAAMGVRLESRAVPSDKSQDVVMLINKHFKL